MTQPPGVNETPHEAARRHLTAATDLLPDGVPFSLDLRALVADVLAAAERERLELPRHRADEEAITVYRIGGGDRAAANDLALYARLHTQPGGVGISLSHHPGAARAAAGDLTEFDPAGVGLDRADVLDSLFPAPSYTAADNVQRFGFAAVAAAVDATARYHAGERVGGVDFGPDPDDNQPDTIDRKE